MTKTILLAITIAMLGISPILSSSNVFAASDTLPGGTLIEITIDDPTDGQVVDLGGAANVDVPIMGTSEIGLGTPIKDTTVVYILDLSGSMSVNAGVDCTGDSLDDTRLTCAKEGIKAANQAAADPFSSVDETGLGSFRASNPGTSHDVNLGTVGPQLIVSPDYDGDSSSTPDIEDVVSGLTASGFTNYFGGLEAADNILGESINTNAIIIFISDGQNNRGPNVTTFTDTNFPANTVIKAFAIGDNVSCSTSSSLGDLDDVAALTPDGECKEITDFSELADEITESIGSELTDIEIGINGAPLVPATSVIPPLPLAGPDGVVYSHTALALGAGTHDICATAIGEDAGGEGSVEECVTIIVNTPPVCDDVVASEDLLWPPNHKLVEITLDGAYDPDGGDVTLTIASVLQDEPTNGLGDGDDTPDAFIDGNSVELRAERSGNGDVKDADGRVYQIAFVVEDENGGTCSGSVDVGVPHDKKDTPVNSGLDYDSTVE